MEWTEILLGIGLDVIHLKMANLGYTWQVSLCTGDVRYTLLYNPFVSLTVGVLYVLLSQRPLTVIPVWSWTDKPLSLIFSVDTCGLWANKGDGAGGGGRQSTDLVE